MAEEYLHQVIGEEVRSISGWYRADKELKLEYNNLELLVVVGAAIVDNSCCGTGGCGYAFVPGYIKKWKHKTDPESKKPISTVELVTDENERAEIEQLIKKNEFVSQVIFMEKA